MALNLKRKREAVSGPRKKFDDGSEKSHDEDEEIIARSSDEGKPEDEETGGGSEDGEEWGGLNDEEDIPPTAGQISRTTPKKPPTGGELRDIKDATELFRSSSFKLQIDALLPNVRPKASRIPPLDRFLLLLHTFLMNLPSSSPQHPLEATRKLLKEGIAVPYCLPLPTEETNWKVAFEKPSDVILVGSWANKLSVKPQDGLRFGVDVAVEMPNSLFQEKDYLNARFFQKKAFYLASIAAAIQNPKSPLKVDVSYSSLHGDPRLTKLVLVPQSNGSQTDFTKLNAQVCIIPVLSSTSPIPLHRLSPSHSNLRINSIDESNANVADAQHPTPIYNNALLLSLTPKPHLLSSYNLTNSTPAFADALTLLRVWANQRGFGQGSHMCVKGFEGAGPWWAGLLESLINGEELQPESKKSERRPFGKGLSSYQLFKTALDCLAKRDFQKEQLFLKTKGGHRYSPEEYRDNSGPVLVDSASLANLLAGVPLGSLDLLRYESLRTLEMLNSSTLSVDPFTKVFLSDNRDLSTRFDVIFRIDISGASPRKNSVLSILDSGSPSAALLSNLGTLLRQALGNRTRAVTLLQPSSTSPSSPHPLSQAHPPTPSTLFLGLVLDPTNAFQLVQHGPAADDPDIASLSQFRELWGPKSELRRFRDGRITESVVWDVKNADERAHVPAMVVRHILGWHFGLKEENVESWQAAYDDVTRLPKEISSRYLEVGGSGVMGFKGALQAFDGLVKSIKALDDELPLSLMNVSPTSEQLRYTGVFSPVPLTPSLAASLPPNARYLQPISIVLEFEKSSKWPDDLRAIQKIKLAFFERLAAALMQSVPGLKANVVIGTGTPSDDNELLDKSCIEIVTPDGWAFHAHIWHDREGTLLDRTLDDKGPLAHIVVPKKKRQEERKGKEYLDAVKAKDMYIRRFIQAPRHHRAIAALCHQYSAFSGTCRLVKRWFGSHWLLASHVSEEVVELLCAQFFVGDGRLVGVDVDGSIPTSNMVPSTKERGFAMVMRFLSEWKWEDGGLWVCLYGVMPTAGENVAAKTEAPRASSGGVWKVSTDVDKAGKTWTGSGPDVVVAHRVKAVAVATWKYLQGIERGGFTVQGMFMHPTNDYDFVIQLDPAVLPRYYHNIAVDTSLLRKENKFANLTKDQNLLLLGFDPARSLCDDLQRTYTDTFRLFFDPYGGDRLGAVWDPTLKEARPFRVLGGFSSIPVPKGNEKEKSKGLVILNENSVLTEIQRLGLGLIKTITAQT